MPHSKSLSVTVSAVNARVYVEASALLLPKLGAHTPDAAALVLHELGGRTARRVAEDYLYCIGWLDAHCDRARPVKRGSARRAVMLKPRGTKESVLAIFRVPERAKPVDPGRN